MGDPDYDEIEQLIALPFEGKVELTEYPSLMLRFIQKYKNNLDPLRASKGLRLTDCKSISFNRLALPVVHI